MGKKNMNKTIPLVYATDNNYALPTAVSIASALESANIDTVYDIYVIVGGDFSRINEKRINQVLEKYPKHKITFFNMQDQYKNSNINTKYITIATYYRLQIASLLENLNKCIYIDSDTFVAKDLSELYNENIDDKYIAGVRAAGYLIPDKTKETMNELELPNIDQYINAGIILFNLDNIRKDNMESVFHSLIPKNYKDQDQSILNKACYGKIKILNLKFNAGTPQSLLDSESYNTREWLRMAFTKEEWDYARLNPVIVHYVGTIKPWNKITSDYADLWWICASKLPFFDDILIEYKSSISELWNIIPNYKKEISSKEEAIKKLTEEKKSVEREIGEIRASKTYKIGRLVTFLPRKVRAAIWKLRKK